MLAYRRRRRTQTRDHNSALPRGQMLFIVGFVFYLALILPFICWGALADPSHPHQTPHFVFSAPAGVQIENAFLARLAALSNDICGNPELNEQVPLPFPSGSEADASVPVGQSLPDSMLAILVLAAIGAWAFSVRLLRHSQFLSLPPLSPVFSPLVPTPPPRIG